VLKEKITESSSFMFCQDIELMFAAQNILLEEPVHTLSTETYGEEWIAGLKRKYHFLIEVFKTMGTNHSHGMLELLLTYTCEDFSLAGFRQYLLGLESTVFIKQFLCLYDMDQATIEAAINNDKALEALYLDLPDMFNSYLGLQSFFRQTQRYIEDYFSFAEELRTEKFSKAIQGVEPDVLRELAKAREALTETPPLEYSQQIMGKTFYNRGPYQFFTFSPSLFLPYRAIRFFGQDQILFFSIRPKPLQEEDMLKQLKVIADGTRYKIISLLSEKGALRGMDIAEALSVAASTVSHHMEQLKTAGLLHEEQVKNSKYYSINKNNVNELLNRLTETLSQK